MYTSLAEAEFSEQRAAQYQGALADYPDAWEHDIVEMLREVQPSSGQTIVDLGGGTGYFSSLMADAVGPNGEVIIVDPSLSQTSAVNRGKFNNVSVLVQNAEEIDVGPRKVDTIWSRGAFHHIQEKEKAFLCFSNIAKEDARLIVADVFQEQATARFFDDFVARTCITGHEVSYLSAEFARTLCARTGWGDPEVSRRTMLWKFASREAMALFLMTLFAARDGTDLNDCLIAVDRHLEFSELPDGVYLHWPMTVMSSRRRH